MLHLSAKIWDAICQHAQEAFPNECCGAILVKNDQEEVRRITNIQNSMNAKDPQQFPRDATIAYYMDPKELLTVNREVDSGKAALKALYHSHPNHDAYFSAEDKRQALFGDEPSYPDTMYLVVSVYDRQVRNIKAFQWNEVTKDFIETELSTNV
jgi:[CysO sulfur-carrier protein]-S-L-cysteine hydrolase